MFQYGQLSFHFSQIKTQGLDIIVGCSFEELKLYLESKFETWMNWDNYGLYNGKLNYGWDIDHIIPLCSALKEEDVILLLKIIKKFNNFQLQVFLTHLTKISP